MMNRPIVVLAVLALSMPASGAAQSSASEREQARIESERQRAEDQRERSREAAERARERAQERRERMLEQRDHERLVRDEAGVLDTVVAFDPRGTVNVSCPGGDVRVTGSERNEIRVKARSENGAIRFTSIGSRATIEPASGRGCNEGRFEISVPVGSKVAASSWSGSVSIQGVHGDIEAHSQSGEVEIKDAGGRLDIESLSGDVGVQGAKGDVSINTVSGDIALTGARGQVEIETVSGSMTLQDASSRQIRSHSTSGDLTFAGQVMDAGRYEFSTHSGDVRLELPSDAGADLSISTFNGGIDSEFPITLKAGDHGVGAAHSKRLSFALGSGTARIVVETFSGDITLTSSGRRR